MNVVQPIRRTELSAAMEEVLRAQSERNWMLFKAGINTGLRISDLLPLRVRDVQEEHIWIKEKKTKKARRVRIMPEMQKLFKRYTLGKDARVYLFPSRKGTNKPLTRSGAYILLRKAANEVGILHMGTHTLRKTFGYNLYKSNKDVAVVQTAFNHASPAITMRYIGITDEQTDTAIDNMGLL